MSGVSGLRNFAPVVHAWQGWSLMTPRGGYSVVLRPCGRAFVRSRHFRFRCHFSILLFVDSNRWIFLSGQDSTAFAVRGAGRVFNRLSARKAPIDAIREHLTRFIRSMRMLSLVLTDFVRGLWLNHGSSQPWFARDRSEDR